jgi:hypothetical protein
MSIYLENTYWSLIFAEVQSEMAIIRYLDDFCFYYYSLIIIYFIANVYMKIYKETTGFRNNE